MKISKILKMLGTNICFAAAAILLYSPGFIGLRLTDANIIRAALSLTFGIMLPAGMLAYNYKALTHKDEHKYIGVNNQYTIEEIKTELQRYVGSRLFGQISRSSLEQLGRCVEMQAGVSEILNRKFDKGSLTYQKFDAIAKSALSAVLSNMANMLNRMRVIDENEYSKLQNYKNDDIPDDIQIQRLELYNKNIEAVKRQRNQNEGLIYKLDELRLELAASETKDMAGSRAFAEIDTLIKEIEYYQD